MRRRLQLALLSTQGRHQAIAALDDLLVDGPGPGRVGACRRQLQEPLQLLVLCLRQPEVPQSILDIPVVGLVAASCLVPLGQRHPHKQLSLSLGPGDGTAQHAVGAAIVGLQPLVQPVLLLGQEVIGCTRVGDLRLQAFHLGLCGDHRGAQLSSVRAHVAPVHLEGISLTLGHAGFFRGRLPGCVRLGLAQGGSLLASLTEQIGRALDLEASQVALHLQHLDQGRPTRQPIGQVGSALRYPLEIPVGGGDLVAGQLVVARPLADGLGLGLLGQETLAFLLRPPLLLPGLVEDVLPGIVICFQGLKPLLIFGHLAGGAQAHRCRGLLLTR